MKLDIGVSLLFCITQQSGRFRRDEEHKNQGHYLGDRDEKQQHSPYEKQWQQGTV
jgi:hypothetical protein